MTPEESDLPEPPITDRPALGKGYYLSLALAAAAIYSVVVPITSIGTKFDNLDERTVRMERDVKAQIQNLDTTLQREYRMIAQRLDSVAERATLDIRDNKVELRKLQDELHALSIRLARANEGGK